MTSGPDEHPERRSGEELAPASSAPASAAPDMARWGRRAATLYLGVAGLALVAMLIETVLGHAGIGTMFAAILAAPWSMLAAAFLPPMPRDWPMAAGLAIRMAPLAVFMLLNAAIIAGIAARSERDLRSAAPRVSLLLMLLAMPFLSGCILSSRQVVLVAAPTATAEYFNLGVRLLVYTFDLTTVPAWRENHGKISDVTDLTLMGTFTFPLAGPGPGPTLSVTTAVTAEPPPIPSIGTEIWGPLQIEYPETQRVNWERGARLFGRDKGLLLDEIRGDGRFGLLVVSRFSNPMTGGVDVPDFHLGAVLEVR
jgi:hypothetical protein